MLGKGYANNSDLYSATAGVSGLLNLDNNSLISGSWCTVHR